MPIDTKVVVEAWCPCGTSCFAPVPRDVPLNDTVIDNALRKHGWTKFKASFSPDESWRCKKCSNPEPTRGVPNVWSASTRES